MPHSELNVPTGLGAVISADRFTVVSICENVGKGLGISCEVFFGKKYELGVI